MIPVTFPIKRTVVYDAINHVKILNKGDVVRCWYCGNPILINEHTACQDANGMQFICCSTANCKKKVSVLYYFDKTIDPDELKAKNKKIKNQSRHYLRITEHNRNYHGDNEDGGNTIDQ